MTTTTSPDFEAARTGLRQWFATLAGLELVAVQWEDEPRSMVTGVCGLINILGDRGRGRPERQHEYDPAAPAGQEIVRRVGGPRELSLSLKLDGYDQRLGRGVFLLMSRVSTRMHGADSLSSLRGMGFALLDVRDVVNLPRDDAHRKYPRAVLDVRLGYTAVEAVSPTTWIETVRVRTHLRDADGVELPSPPNGEITIEAQ